VLSWQKWQVSEMTSWLNYESHQNGKLVQPQVEKMQAGKVVSWQNDGAPI